MKVLIVEDDADSRTYLERALKTQGYFVESAANGVAGLEKAEQSPPDLIISDIMMPEMDGFELCRRVKADEQLRGIPFIFYTATYVEQKDEKLAMALGASRFLIKPMELDDFFCAVKGVIDQHREGALVVPQQQLTGTCDLDRMQLEAVARKLDKKVRELEAEHEMLRVTEHLLTGQKRVLEMIATNAPLAETLTALVNFLESGSEGIYGSILLLDEDGLHVRHGAAPSLPDAYTKAVDGAVIGPRAGSCGTAMFRCEPVVVTDILHDPLWDDYRHLIVPHGLNACWSTPILSHDGKVLGSFAMYYRDVRSPGPSEERLIDIATHIASIAIEHHRAGEEIRKTGAELRESEERMQFASSAADIGAWHWDLRANVLLWSDKCKELFGYPREFPVTYESFLQSVHEDDRQRIHGAVRKALREKGDYMVEMRIIPPDGRLRWVMSKGRGFYDEQGRPVRMHGIAMDITERKNYEQELVEARYAAEAANRAKSQFLANMSHELRTPMAGVLGMLEIALGGPLEDEQRDFIITAHNSAGSLVNILTDILEMTKIEAGVLAVADEPFVLPDCVRSVVDIFRSEAEHKGLGFIIQIPDDLPEHVVGDCKRLRQVLTNLVGNAIKFTKSGKVELTVAAGDLVPSGRRGFIFTVKDTGIGIPEDKKHLVFRPFSQVDESHSRRYGGTGLGLTISKEIVERMGGTITFDCKEGEGCTFTFIVPFG